jgi:hypothetical protein
MLPLVRSEKHSRQIQRKSNQIIANTQARPETVASTPVKKLGETAMVMTVTSLRKVLLFIV